MDDKVSVEVRVSRHDIQTCVRVLECEPCSRPEFSHISVGLLSGLVLSLPLLSVPHKVSAPRSVRGRLMRRSGKSAFFHASEGDTNPLLKG